MAGPKEIEERLRKAITSWETMAPTKSFGGLTLDQFKRTQSWRNLRVDPVAIAPGTDTGFGDA
jgi:hypothetical protein